jgi:Lar family restriction alleviation protein
MTIEQSDGACTPSFSSAELERVLPCPFCGSDKIGVRYEGQPALRYAYMCCDCGGTVGGVFVGGTPSGSHVLFNNPHALEKWNKRSNAEVSGRPLADGRA